MLPRFGAALFLLAALSPPLSVAGESADCASSVDRLRVLAGDAAFPLHWHETTMNDGKPLVVTIAERHGLLVLEFVKTGEGLWAESTGTVCKTAAGLEARFTGDQVRLGPAANWLLRHSLRGGGRFTLTRPASGELRIATTGWSGSFAPRDR